MKLLKDKTPKVIKPITHQLYIDGMRGITASYVVMHHIMLSLKFPAASAAKAATIDVFKYGHYVVDIFIVLSGYCLTLPILNSNFTFKKGTIDFFKRRFLRIYPTYLLSLIFSIILATTLLKQKSGTLFDLSIPFDYKDVITHIALVNDFFYTSVYKINYVYWSVAVECRIYLLFPLILWVCKRWNIKFAFFGSFVLSIIIWAGMFRLQYVFPDLDIRDSGVHPYLILFVSGMFGAELSFNQSNYTKNGRLTWLGMILITLIIIVLQQFSYGYTIQDIMVGLITMWFIVGMNNSDSNVALSAIKKMLSWKPFVFLGSFAYSIYLFHPIFIQLITFYVIKPIGIDVFISYYLFLLVGVPVILLLCYLSFLAFEKPFWKYRQKIGLVEINLKEVLKPGIKDIG